MENSGEMGEQLAYEKLLEAVKNCKDDVTEEVLSEYENLVEG